MNESIIKEKVYIFNSLLPSVKQHLINERKRCSLKEKMKKDEYSQKKIKEAIASLEGLPELLDGFSKLSTDVNSMLNEWKDTLKNENEKLIKSIESSSAEISQLYLEFDFRKSLYLSTLSYLTSTYTRIHSDKTFYGFIKKEDLQEDYVQEYLYLLYFDKQPIPCLTPKSLFFDSEAKNAFYEMLSKKFPNFKDKLLEFLDNGKLSKDLKDLLNEIF